MLYRNMTEADFDDVVELVYQVWFTELTQISSEEVKKLAAVIDTSLLFMETTHAIVAIDEDEDRIVGVVGVRGLETLATHLQQQHETRIAEALEAGKAFGSELSRNLSKLEQEFRKHWELVKEHRVAPYDGEVTLLLLDTSHHGRKIGQALLERGLAWCKSQGCSLICLDTDDSCNYQIYDHLGWKRAVEYPYKFEIFGVKYNQMEYVYEWEL
ncbi:MAG: GNAT family N-acetyltransferase [Coriobacteriia bacterium]|nr:GNAT family N-acetyltransferase [Coriobacteriia bacterium]